MGLMILYPGTLRADRPPNVILFLVDDLGWADLSLTGSTFYETPHVDRLAAQGVFFDNAYAASPVCTPTRASILSGKYPHRIGLSYLAGTSGMKGPGNLLVPPPVGGNLPESDITLAEALKEAGYRTAHIGKWHLQAHHEKGRDHFPEKHGFDINIGGHNAGQPGSYHFPYKSERHAWSNVPDMDDGGEGDYLTDALTDKAIGFITQNRDKPFFLNMWFYTVHTPIMPRKDKLKKYQEKAGRMGLSTSGEEAIPEMNGYYSHRHQDNASYAAMVESMDENIGRILNALQRLDIDKNTIVIFFSDNGGLSTGRGPKMPTSNLPLRGGKAWLFEGGIRVPCIVRYPGGVKPGRKIEEPVVSTDLYPTILDLAGLPLKPEQHLDGVSLKPVLSGEKTSLGREAIYFHLPHYHHINSMGPSGAVRAGDFKLIEIFESGQAMLFNLREDIGETRDLANEMPMRTESLRKMLHQWRKDTAAEMTSLNPDYDPDLDYRFLKK